MRTNMHAEPGPKFAAGGARLPDVAELIPGLPNPVLAGGVDPVLHLGKARLDVLAVAEAAALAAQQQLVEQLHVDEGEELLEQLAHQEGGHVRLLQLREQRVQHVQDVAPVRAQHLAACAHPTQRRSGVAALEKLKRMQRTAQDQPQ